MRTSRFKRSLSTTVAALALATGGLVAASAAAQAATTITISGHNNGNGTDTVWRTVCTDGVCSTTTRIVAK